MSWHKTFKKVLFALLGQAHKKRSSLLIFLDLGSIYCASVLALSLETAFQFSCTINDFIFVTTLPTLIYFLCIRTGQSNKFLWRHFSLDELKSVIVPVIIGTIILMVNQGSFALSAGPYFNGWSFLAINFITTTIALTGVRLFRRMTYEWEIVQDIDPKATKKNLLLVGAGIMGKSAARQLSAGPNLHKYNIVGFIDDNSEMHGYIINGYKILGGCKDAGTFSTQYQIDEIIITVSRNVDTIANELFRVCEGLAVKIRILPAYSQILSGQAAINTIRDVQITDLLAREPINLDTKQLTTFIADKTVLITGAGGSIGSELARQAASFKPHRLILVERSEAALFSIEQDLNKLEFDNEIHPVVADVCDKAAMNLIFSNYKPEVVIHAAAHKHVPLMELNPVEAIRNNVMGTKIVGELAIIYGSTNFVLISTDKAVSPRSIMGATKRLAEQVTKELSTKGKTIFCAVRFGNVLGSSGSVIPIFKKQIKAGGPVTVTHPEMTRYFMTIPEACQLVLQAASFGNGGELFILDMGSPVKIVDLAKNLIRLSGFTPDKDIKIAFSGIRPGEKLHETLHTSLDELIPTHHKKINKAALDSQLPDFWDKIEYLISLDPRKEDIIRAELSYLLPDSSLVENRTPKIHRQSAEFAEA